MSFEKFRLDWRNSPQKQLDALQEVLKYFSGMYDQLVGISSKLNALPEIKAAVDAQRTILEDHSTLLQLTVDNTTCACNALQDVNEKLSEIIDILQDLDPDPPVPEDPYSFYLYSSSHELSSADIANGYFNLSGISTKDGELFDSIEIIDCPDYLDPVVSVLPDNVIRFGIIPGVVIPVGEFGIELKQYESDIVQEFLFFYSDYIDILGVKFAKTPLIADPGDSTGMTSIFAPRADMYCDFYQWNRRKAWPSAGAVSGWDNSSAPGDLLWPENDPSPDGWRIPTKEELELLFFYGSTWRAAGEAGNEVPGRFFGVAHAAATMDDPMGCLFLPASGSRHSSNGDLEQVGESGEFWSDAVPSGVYAYSFRFTTGNPFVQDDAFRNFGLSLICVKGAKLIPPVYGFSYNAGGGILSGGTAAGNYYSGKTVTLPTRADRLGYDFVGFESSAWSGTKALGATFVMPANALSVTAVWQSPPLDILIGMSAVVDDASLPLYAETYSDYYGQRSTQLSPNSVTDVFMPADCFRLDFTSAITGNSRDITLFFQNLVINDFSFTGSVYCEVIPLGDAFSIIINDDGAGDWSFSAILNVTYGGVTRQIDFYSYWN